MWPFTKSNSAKTKAALEHALEASMAPFSAALRDGSLFRAMQSDPYISGYVFARVITLTVFSFSVDSQSVEVAMSAAFEYVLPTFLGEHTRSIGDSWTNFQSNPATKELWQKGDAEGKLITSYVAGRADIRDHPLYEEAVKQNDVAAKYFPASDAFAKQVQIATALEFLLFGRYMLEHFGEEAEAEFSARLAAEAVAESKVRK